MSILSIKEKPHQLVMKSTSCSEKVAHQQNQNTTLQSWKQIFLSLLVLFTFFSHYNNGRIWNLYGPDRSGVYGGAQGIGVSMGVRHQISNFLTENCEIASPDPTSTIGGLEATYTLANGTSSGVINNYFGDGLGTISSSQPRTAYGSVLGGYGPMPGSSVNSNSLVPQWRGHYLDPTGFYYMGARYYEPNSGRFLSADPLGHDASLDLYSYCNGDPVNGLDPDGRCVEGMVPGNAAWQQSVASYNNGDYLGASVGFVGMIGEQMLTALSFGVGPAAVAGIEAASSVATEAIENAAQEGIFTTWNEFQAGTRGQFANRAEAASYWAKYKEGMAAEIQGIKEAQMEISWNPLTGPGPLGENIASAFRRSTYVEKLLQQPTTLYRVYSDPTRALGPYWTRIKPAGPIQSIIDSSLNPVWGERSNKFYKN